MTKEELIAALPERLRQFEIPEPFTDGSQRGLDDASRVHALAVAQLQESIKAHAITTQRLLRTSNNG